MNPELHDGIVTERRLLPIEQRQQCPDCGNETGGWWRCGQCGHRFTTETNP